MMKCPYCQGEMQRGTLTGDGRSAVYFQQGGKKLTFSDRLCGIGRVVTKRQLYKFVIVADYCEACKKVIFDAEIGK